MRPIHVSVIAGLSFATLGVTQAEVEGDVHVGISLPLLKLMVLPCQEASQVFTATQDPVLGHVVEELLVLIQTLSPQYRMVFNLYAIEGFSHREIGEELGISVGTSKSNLSRARAILQQKIKSIYGVEIRQ